MSEYTKKFVNPYPNGWKDLPSHETPVTANALQEHTDAIESIEDYLNKNPITQLEDPTWSEVKNKPFTGIGNNLTVDEDGNLNAEAGGSNVEWNQLQKSGTKIAEITIEGQKTDVYSPTGGGTEFVELTKEQYDALPDTKLTDGIPRLITDYSEGSIKGTTANSVQYDNTETQLEADNVQDAIDEVFQSVSNGKELIAEAITDKGIETSATDTFQIMANNIVNIPSGGIEYDKYTLLKKCEELGCSLQIYAPNGLNEDIVVTINESIENFITTYANSYGAGIAIKNNSSKTVRLTVFNYEDIQYGIGNASASLPTLVTNGANRESFSNKSRNNTFSIDIAPNKVGFAGSYPGNWTRILVTELKTL